MGFEVRAALSHPVSKGSFAALDGPGKPLTLLNQASARRQVATSKSGICDGVDGARAASGSMKSSARMVVVRATV